MSGANRKKRSPGASIPRAAVPEPVVPKSAAPDTSATGVSVWAPRDEARPSAILRVSSLTKNFGGLRAIGNLSFDVRARSITAVIGPNGAGKTTLFNLISGFYKPDHGEIVFKDRRIDLLRAHEIPALGIARTFQNLSVYANMSVLENVMTGRHTLSTSGLFACSLGLRRCRREERDIEARAFDWLRFMNMETLAHRKVTEVPFESQRYVEITRAVAAEPDLILLDEPAAGLNVTETKNLVDAIYKIRELGITILIVEHDMDLVMEVSDRIVVLNFGEKVAEGPPKEIRKNERVIDVYLGKG
jgi:branched-chain amino acid transport system ATP-binding protein